MSAVNQWDIYEPVWITSLVSEGCLKGTVYSPSTYCTCISIYQLNLRMNTNSDRSLFLQMSFKVSGVCHIFIRACLCSFLHHLPLFVCLPVLHCFCHFVYCIISVSEIDPVFLVTREEKHFPAALVTCLNTNTCSRACLAVLSWAIIHLVTLNNIQKFLHVKSSFFHP